MSENPFAAVKVIADSLKDEKNEEKLPSTEFVEKVRQLSDTQLKLVWHLFDLFFGHKFLKQIGKIILGVVGIITGAKALAEGIIWLIGVF